MRKCTVFCFFLGIIFTGIVFGEESSPMSLCIAPAQLQPRQDGKIENREYTFNATGFRNVTDQRFSYYQSKYHLSYDADKIYIGLSTPVTNKLSAACKERDDVKICHDDVFEIFLCPDKSKSRYFHLIFNSSGQLYDEENTNPAWNADGISIKNHITEQQWTAELAIPFKALGCDTPQNRDTWKINIARSFPVSGLYTCIAPVRRKYNDIDNFANLSFLETAPYVNIKSIGQLFSGNLCVDVSMRNRNAHIEKIHTSVQLGTSGVTILNSSRDFLLKQNEVASVLLDRQIEEKNAWLKIEIDADGKDKLYIAKFPFAVSDFFQFEYLYTLPEKGVLKIGIQQLELSRNGKLFTVSSEIFDKENKKVLSRTIQPGKYNYELELNIESLKPGDYRLETALFDPDGHKVSGFSNEYRKFSANPQWHGKNAGITDKIPIPWCALEVVSDSVKCWGREYVFKNNLLPTQIVSQNDDLLSDPIRILGTVNKKEIHLQNVNIRWSEKKSDKVRLMTSGKSGPLDMQCDIFVEYDGFMWVKLDINPELPVEVEKLAIEIPMKKEYASLINSTNARLSGTGSLYDGWSANLKDLPVFWIGNEKTGIQWFAENLAGWHMNDPARSAEIKYQKGNPVVMLNIIDSPLVLKEKRTISFGLMATPVKSRCANWRKWKIGVNLELWFPYLKLLSYPDPNNLIKGKSQELKELKNKNEQVCIYLAFHAASPLTPEWKYYGETWRCMPEARLRREPGTTGDEWAECRPCTNAKAYVDFYTCKLAQFVRETGMSDFYFDWGQVLFCNNKLHGCGWTDENGNLCTTYNILGARDFAKRCYSIIKSNNPDSVIANHPSGQVVMPVHSFCDIIADGESLAPILSSDFYYKILPLDKFRAEYMLHQFGPVEVLIPQFTRASEMYNLQGQDVNFWKSEAAQKPIRHLLGLALIHDVKCWPAWGVNMNQIWKIEDAFGWDDKVVFLPYWNNSAYVRITSPISENIVVSAFKRGEKILLIPFNNTDKDEVLKIKVEFDKLDIPAGENYVLHDKTGNASFNLQAGIASVPVRSREFMILEIGH